MYQNASIQGFKTYKRKINTVGVIGKIEITLMQESRRSRAAATRLRESVSSELDQQASSAAQRRQGPAGVAMAWQLEEVGGSQCGAEEAGQLGGTAETGSAGRRRTEEVGPRGGR